MNEIDPDLTAPPPDLEKSAPDADLAYSRWKVAPSPHSMSDVLKGVEPVIKSQISRFPGTNETLLRSEARRLAVQAVKTYDPAHGSSLQTHVFNHLRPLARFTQKTSRAVTVPRDAREGIANLMRAKQDFMEEHGREPSDAELQDLTGLSGDKFSRLSGMAFYEMPEGKQETPVAVTPEDSRIGMWTDFVYHDLPNRDRLIMDYRLGRNGRPVTDVNKIAAILKVDPSYVHKRVKSIASQILQGVQEHSHTPLQSNG